LLRLRAEFHSPQGGNLLDREPSYRRDDPPDVTTGLVVVVVGGIVVVVG
jgi:hypothetical protein